MVWVSRRYEENDKKKEEIKWRSQDEGNIVHAFNRKIQEMMGRKEKESVVDDGTEEG